MPHTGPKPLLPYSTKTQGRRQISISSRQEVMQTGQTPRPLPKQPDIQTETTEGKPSEPLISTTKRQGEGGPEGRAAAGEHQTNQDNQQDQTQKQTNQQGGQGQARPTTRRPNTQETQQRQNKKPQRPATEATGKGKRHGIRPRESHQGKPYQGTKNMNFDMEEGPVDFPQRETRH